jgi:3-hydroxy-9,10-secoandrosta-1,3,5(10)-triene-9,17-dione monooxygenase
MEANTPKTLAERARALLPQIRERAEKAESLRRLPEETLADLRDAGLLRALQPARFGGTQLDFDALLGAAAEVGRACGSSAWCLAILGIHNWLLGLFPLPAQDEVWGAAPDALAAACFAPTGKAEPDGDGYRLSGRWQFASGCDHAGWAAVAAPIARPGAPFPDVRLFLVPVAELRIEDTWFVAGLRGTGSKDLVVEGVLVPEHRTLSLAHALAGTTPGASLHDAPVYRAPFTTMLGLALAGPALGIARGALDAYTERTRERVQTYGSAKLAEQMPMQIRLAEAAAEIDGAALLLERACRDVARGTRGEIALDLAARARIRRDTAYAVRVCTRAVDRLFEASGAHGLFDSSPLQRAFRDLHAMSAHAFLSWDQSAAIFGALELGLPSPNPIV